MLCKPINFFHMANNFWHIIWYLLKLRDIFSLVAAQKSVRIIS